MEVSSTLRTLDLRGGSRGGKLPGEHHQHDVGAETEDGQERDAVAAGAELLVHVALVVLGGEELLVALIAAVDGDQQHAGPVQREEGADGVEVGREDLEDDEGEAELRQRRPHVCTLKGSLRGANLNEPGTGVWFRRAVPPDGHGDGGCLLVRGQNDGAGAVHPQMEVATLGNKSRMLSRGCPEKRNTAYRIQGSPTYSSGCG